LAGQRGVLGWGSALAVVREPGLGWVRGRIWWLSALVLLVAVLREKVDLVIRRIAARQHGAVARAQLLAKGVTRHEIEARMRSSLLLPVHRGVYLVTYGPRASLALEAAAVLACRPSAMLSHRTVGHLMGIPVPPARATLRRHPNRRGARALRELLDAEGGVRVTRSNAERTAFALMRSHGLEPNASDFPIGPYSVDFWFAAERVAVEFDSRRYHDNSKRFVTDRRRNRYLAARDITTVALTDTDLDAYAEEAMRELRETLEARRQLNDSPAITEGRQAPKRHVDLTPLPSRNPARGDRDGPSPTPLRPEPYELDRLRVPAFLVRAVPGDGALRRRAGARFDLAFAALESTSPLASAVGLAASRASR